MTCNLDVSHYQVWCGKTEGGWFFRLFFRAFSVFGFLECFFGRFGGAGMEATRGAWAHRGAWVLGAWACLLGGANLFSPSRSPGDWRPGNEVPHAQLQRTTPLPPPPTAGVR